MIHRFIRCDGAECANEVEITGLEETYDIGGAWTWLESLGWTETRMYGRFVHLCPKCSRAIEEALAEIEAM